MPHLSGKILAPSQGITSWERCQGERASQFIDPENGEIGTLIADTYFATPEKKEIWIASLVRYTKTYKKMVKGGEQSAMTLEYKIQSNLIHPNPIWTKEGPREIFFNNEKAGLSILERYSIDAVLKILKAKSLTEGDRIWNERYKSHEELTKIKEKEEKKSGGWLERSRISIRFYSLVFLAVFSFVAFLHFLHRVYYLVALNQIGLPF